MVKKIIAVLLCTAVFISLLACSYSPPIQGNSGLSIVASNFPAYDFCRELAGDKAEITMLLSPGEEPHSFDPTPMDVYRVQEADLFVYCGGESDEWVESILDSADGNIPTVKMIDCVSLFEEELKDGMEIKGEGEEDEEETEYDEHVWTSPKNSIEICKDIYSMLCEIDSVNTDYYTQRFNNYTEKLVALDKQFRQTVEGAAIKELIFADRFPLLYFFREYGLDYYAAFPGCSGETEASPSTIGFLIDKIVQKGYSYVMKLELSSDAMAKSVSNQTNAQILTFYSCQTVSKDDFENGETYLTLMQKNVETLNKVLN